MTEPVFLDNDPCYCCRESGCNDGCRCDGSNNNFFAVWGDARVKALLEAAPELLAALENLVDVCGQFDAYDGYGVDDDEMVIAARAAIAKARGEPCPTE